MRLDLDQLLRDEKPIYVVNCTKPRGILVVTFPTAAGTDRIVIPKTAHPVNLSARVPTEFLRQSMELRRFLQRGILILVDPEAAQKLLSDPDVEEELQEATERTFTHGKEAVTYEPEGTSATSGAAIEAMKNLVGNKMAKEEASTSRNDVAEEPEVELNLRAKVVMQRVASGEMKVRAALGDLKAISTELSEEDLSYILSQSPTGQIASWVKRKLEDLHAPEESDTDDQE